MAGRTGLRMGRLLVVVALALWAGSGAANAQVSRDQRDVKSVWAAYRKAMVGIDGATAASLLSANTVAYYEKIRKLALYAPHRRLKSHSILDRLLVYQIRHFHGAAKVSSMTARQVIAWTIDAGLSSSGDMRTLDIGVPRVTGGVAIAPVLHNGRRVTRRFRFVREAGNWRFDLMPLVEQGAVAAERMIRARKLTVKDLLTMGLKDRSRKKVDMAQLVKPLISR